MAFVVDVLTKRLMSLEVNKMDQEIKDEIKRQLVESGMYYHYASESKAMNRDDKVSS